MLESRLDARKRNGAVAGILIAARPENIFDIGVYNGGSFALWPAAKIGIDSGSNQSGYQISFSINADWKL